MSRPEIAFDVTPLQNAHRFRGIGTYVRGLATRLAAQSDIPLEFWSLNDARKFDVSFPHRTRLLPRMPTPQYRGAWLFAQLAMRRLAAASPVRAVHVTDPSALTTLTGHRVLATVYDLIPLKEGISRRRPLVWAGYRSYLRMLPRVDVLFAISQQTAKDLVDQVHVPLDRVVVAPPGIDLARPDTASVRRPRPYFLYLGGPNPNKNLGVLIEAFASCPGLPEELLIAGLWLPKQLAALRSSLEKVGLAHRTRHLGFVPASELAALMQHATAVVVPSLDEGFGLPVGEGLAAGAVVLHSRIGVLEETSAGSALTFDPRSAEELAACLRRVSADESLRAGFRARSLARASELTWDAAVEATLATYRRLLDG